MPIVFLDRLPLPSLQTYAAISILVLSGSIYYALQGTTEPEWRGNWTTFVEEEKLLSDWPNLSQGIKGIEVLYFMMQEPLCIWTLINMAYCCLLLFGKVIQKIVFGELRVSEQQHIKDKFWNFVFYKFIFIFGVMNVQNMDEVLMWCGWFSMLGFLHILAQLCKDRCEYVCFSPATPKWTHIKLVGLLLGIFIVATSLLIFCYFLIWPFGLNLFTFMAAECLLVIVRTSYVMTRYAIHIRDFNHDGVWENRGRYIYFSELTFELIALVIDFLHHLHMLVWSNIFLSMASLVNGMQLHHLFHEIQRKYSKHKNYLRVLHHMENNYPMATPHEIENNSDDCAICWDKLESARVLPCGHMFHNSCLQSWLEQDTSCPTCRTSLSVNQESDNENQVNTDAGNRDNEAPAENQPMSRATNHFFHFDGSRYISWFPSFSVEVTHRQILRGAAEPALETSQLNSMGSQVLQMFPHIPLSTIIEDLQTTRSIEVTIENILEGRILIPNSVSSIQVQSQNDATTSLVQNTEATNSENAQDLSPIDDESTSPERTLPSSSGQLENNFFFIDEAVANPEATASSSDNQNAECIQPIMVSGSRFSKSASEREKILSERKNLLISNARKRYVSKHKKDQPLDQADNLNVETFTNSQEEPVRNLAYEAAQRRLNGQHSAQ